MRLPIVTRLARLVVVAAVSGCTGAPPPPATVVEVAPPRPPAPPPTPPGEDEAEALSVEELNALLEAKNDGTASSSATRRVDGAGFHYEVPSGWEELDPATLGSHLIRCAQRNTQAVDAFMTNVNVASEPFVGDGPAYADANLIELRKASTIRNQRAARAGDRPASDIEAYWANAGGVPYVTQQRYVTDGREGFVITCSAAASAFERERPLCDRVLDSFRVE